MKRPVLAIIFLSAGLFMIMEGSRLYASSFVTDLAILIIGAILTISYFPLIQDYLEKRYNAKPSITYMPILAALGACLLWQAGFRILTILDKAIFAVIGTVLLLGSVFFIYKTIKSR